MSASANASPSPVATEASPVPQPRRRPLRAFSSTPIAHAFYGRRAIPILVFGCAGPFALRPLFDLPWPLSVTGVALLLVVLALLVARDKPQRQFVAAVREVHAEFPWFTASLLEWVDPERVSDLREALARRGFTVHELAAERVRTFADALVALEPIFGARKFPADPVARLAVSAAETVYRRGGRIAVLWRGATQVAERDSEAWTRFAEEWSRRTRDYGPAVLWLLERAPVEAQAAAR